MKAWIVTILLPVVFAMWAGCASPQRGAAYGHEKEIWKQLEKSLPIQQYGYALGAVRYSSDYRKILVIFTHPDHSQDTGNGGQRPDWEFVLTADDFGRYRGVSMQPFYTPGTGNTPQIAVTVSVPAK